MTDTIQTATEDGKKLNPPATEGEKTPENNDEGNTEPKVDYKEKFGASTAENQRIMAEIKAKDEEIERLRKIAENGGSNTNDSEALYPGFENLDDEAKNNLIAYTKMIQKNTLDEVHKDPSLKFARETYNEKVWSDAFEDAATNFPELRDSKDDFKKKYFRPDNVPSNIKDLMLDLAKVHLFDKAKDMGAKRAEEQADRIDIERAKGGDKTPKASRTLEDWAKMAESNPAEFAKNSKKFNEDMAAGKL